MSFCRLASFQSPSMNSVPLSFLPFILTNGSKGHTEYIWTYVIIPCQVSTIEKNVLTVSLLKRCTFLLAFPLFLHIVIHQWKLRIRPSSALIPLHSDFFILGGGGWHASQAHTQSDVFVIDRCSICDVQITANASFPLPTERHKYDKQLVVHRTFWVTLGKNIRTPNSCTCCLMSCIFAMSASKDGHIYHQLSFVFTHDVDAHIRPRPQQYIGSQTIYLTYLLSWSPSYKLAFCLLNQESKESCLVACLSIRMLICGTTGRWHSFRQTHMARNRNTTQKDRRIKAIFPFILYSGSNLSIVSANIFMSHSTEGAADVCKSISRLLISLWPKPLLDAGSGFVW